MPYTSHPSRRTFLQLSSVTAAAVAAKPLWSMPASERVNFCIIGAGGRGSELAGTLSKTPNAGIVAVADPDSDRAEKLANAHNARAFQDLRKALELPEVDAVVISTCNHWHCLAALWALDAGKHVYVEKPLSHTQWEGQQLVRAAQRSGKVVQIGTQQRSDPMQAEAKAFLHTEQQLGAIKYVQANRLGPRGSIGKKDQPIHPPSSVDYSLWLGPAREQPIYRDKLHYDWHWDWNTGNGEMGNWGVHILDDIRNVAYQDTVHTPTRILAAGARIGWKDAGNTPNVHFALFETESFPTLIALSNLALPSDGKSNWKCPLSGRVHGPSSGYVIACEGGYYLGQRGHGKAIDLDGKEIKKFSGANIVPIHVANFVESVRANDPAMLNGSIEQGHFSSGWCNLANVGVQLGKSFASHDFTTASTLERWPELVGQMTDQMNLYDASEQDLICSPLLNHDPKTEQFTGDFSEEANRLLRREDRAGFQVPEIT